MAASSAPESDFDVESFIHEHYDAWGGTDEDRILSYYADHVVFHIPGMAMAGKEALRDQFVRPFITAFPGNRHLVKSMILGPGVVAVEFSFEAQHKGPFAGHAATGARVALPGCGVYEFDAAKGQIIAGRIYFDVRTLLQTITESLADDREKAEAAVQSSERNVSLMTNAIPALIHTAWPDGNIDFFNQQWLKYVGLPLKDLEGWKWTAVIHPADVEGIVKRWREALVSGEPFVHEARVRRADGEYRWMLHHKTALRDEHGRIVKWHGSSIDIEERKRAEGDVRRSGELLAETQRLSSVGGFYWRAQTNEVIWSEEAYRIFQVDQGVPVTLELIASRVHPDDLPLFHGNVDRARNEAGDFEYERRLLMPDHSVKHLHLIAHATRDRDGQLEYIGALQDVTERKSAEEALNRARAELAHMARVTTLSALTASIAHEINQPIAAAISSAGACLRWLDRDQPEVQRAREAAMRIEEDGRRASEIIARLKSFYRKDVSPRREAVSVNDVVGEMLMLLRSEADRHSVVMRTEAAADLPPVSADRVQLQQVLMNLMLNGMEAMRERGGELTIGTRRENGGVMVSASDTGVGIPADKVEDIFNPFFTTKAGGTGMGLAISRTIIESHGGRLWATVNPGHGATFYFTLPAEPEARP